VQWLQSQLKVLGASPTSPPPWFHWHARSWIWQGNQGLFPFPNSRQASCFWPATPYGRWSRNAMHDKRNTIKASASRWAIPGAWTKRTSRCVANGSTWTVRWIARARTVDFLLSKRRDIAAAKRAFAQATRQQGAPRVIPWTATPPRTKRWPNSRKLARCRSAGASGPASI
jgi:hypothetical protein